MENKLEMQELGKLILTFGRGEIDYEKLEEDNTPEKVNKKINDKVFSMLGVDPKEIKSELHLAKAVRGKENLLYAILEEVITEGAFKQISEIPFFNRFVDYRNESEGDETVFYVEGVNKLIVSRTAGNGVEIQKQRLDNGKEFTVDLENYSIGIIESLKRILLGRTSWATLAQKMDEAVAEKIQTKIYESFQQTVSKLPTAFNYTGSFDEEEISERIERVEGSTGVKPVLVGTKSALRRLKGIDWNGYSDSMKADRNKLGYIPDFLGYDCMPIDQQLKAGSLEELLFANDEIYIMASPNKFIKTVVREGMIGNNETTQHQNQSLALDYNFELGISVVSVLGLGLIKLV